MRAELSFDGPMRAAVRRQPPVKGEERMSGRSKMLAAALTAAALAMAAPGMAASAAEKIVISNWDAYMPADLLERFTQETTWRGVTIAYK